MLYSIKIQDFNGKETEYKSFLKENSDNQTVFCSKDNKVKLTVINGETVKYFAVISERIKKCVIRLKTVAENAVILRHNESVLDFADSGILTNPKKGKSTYFLSLKSGEKNFHFANELPCKFLSYFEFNKKGSKYFVDFITEFPYTFEGEFITEKLLFSNKEGSEGIKSFLPTEEKDFEFPIGWSTWDYYFTDINHDCIKENVEFICRDEVLSKKIKYISIDDGWEQSEGFWKEGATFPKGLKNTAKYISDKGFVPGIWTCPVRINELCPIIMRRNSFLIRNEFGDPITFTGNYVVDPTHPDGEKYIRETYTYLYDCGFRYFKVDFISHILEGQRFYDKSAGHYDAIRRLLKIIRECVGDSHIMGCNMPYGVGYGYVDSKRVGLDIHNLFGHVKICSEIFTPQFACHKTVYQNDLDYLVVRGDDTSEKDEYNVLNPSGCYFKTHPEELEKGFVWRGGKDFSYNEAKTWCTVVLMTGSSVFLGDRLSKLNDKGLKLIHKVLENEDSVGATPVDLMENPFPSVWKKKGVIAVVNFLDTPRDISFSAEEKEYKDIFTDAVYESKDGKITISLAPHDSAYLKVV